MISAADKGPVVEMVKELRSRGVTVYAVDENFLSKWCAACAMADPAAAKANKTNLLGKKDKKVYQTRACRRCGVRVQRDRNAAVNISFAIKQLVFEDQAKDADGNPPPAARPKHRYHRKCRTTPTVDGYQIYYGNEPFKITLHGDGGYINWYFIGKWDRDGKHVKFNQ
ncbi:hypothetical protein H9P43_005873 [Blastocladiella emersonii ATCC 22665]|nr:hypothetical protein H9P43_005873 [Blastocladiella emersonii ATCC 22665]